MHCIENNLWAHIDGPVRGGIDVLHLNFKLCHVAISEGSDVAVAISSMQFLNVRISLEIIFNNQGCIKMATAGAYILNALKSLSNV